MFHKKKCYMLIGCKLTKEKLVDKKIILLIEVSPYRK